MRCLRIAPQLLSLLIYQAPFAAADEPLPINRVLCIGDSNTYRLGDPQVDSYCTTSRHDTFNAGKSGFDSQEWAEMAQATPGFTVAINAAHDLDNFTICSIMLGQNDTASQPEAHTGEEYRSYIEVIIAECQAMGINRALLHSPMGGQATLYDDLLEDYDDALAAIVDESCSANYRMGENILEMVRDGEFDDTPWTDPYHLGQEHQDKIRDRIDPHFDWAPTEEDASCIYEVPATTPPGMVGLVGLLAIAISLAARRRDRSAG